MTDRPSTGRPPMGARTGYRLVKLADLLLALADQTLATLGVKAKHVHVLETLLAYESLSQQDVSRLLGIDPNVLVGLLDDLEARGFAERRRNPHDRRRHVVQVTDSGRELVAESTRLLGDAEDAFFAVVSEQELQVVHDASGRLLAAHRPGWTDNGSSMGC
ncbi:MarR family winged helix-turn-helix transcriptional regulator [Embleya sp. NPDC008237]|uniref:MarR family winged helix-turn-helix transcriptional regulator n=1 Tax=Embleya sp. NPDC008237 TaxID=3363978 RepID=UPI0036E3469C